MYQCPRCDRLLTDKDFRHSKCEICGLEFSGPEKADVSKIQKQSLLDMFGEEILRRNKQRVDYYLTSVNILKAYLSNTVYFKRANRTAFFLTDDMEIKSFLFDLGKHTKCIRMIFDHVPKYKGVVKLTPEQRKRAMFGGAKSLIDLRDFEIMMDIAMTIYKLKSAKYCGTDKADNSRTLYIYR